MAAWNGTNAVMNSDGGSRKDKCPAVPQSMSRARQSRESAEAVGASAPISATPTTIEPGTRLITIFSVAWAAGGLVLR